MAVSKFFAVFVVVALLGQVFAATVHQVGSNVDVFNRIKRSSDPDCHSTTPCGWAVYKRYTRVIDYFMKNKCECPEGRKCVRTDDDLSVTAYVYRCKDVGDENKNNLEES